MNAEQLKIIKDKITYLEDESDGLLDKIQELSDADFPAHLQKANRDYIKQLNSKITQNHLLVTKLSENLHA